MPEHGNDPSEVAENEPARGLRASWTRDPAVVAGLFAALVCLALAPGVIDNIDTRIAFRGAQSLLSRGTFALEHPTQLERAFLWTGQGVDGEIYSKFGAGLSVTLLPFVALARLIAPLLPFPRGQVEELLASFATPVLAGVGVHAMVRLMLDHLRLSAGAAVTGALAWSFCTFQFAYTGSAYLETPVAVCGVLALRHAMDARVRGGRRATVSAVLAGAFAAWTVALKVALLVIVPFLLAPLLTRDRRATQGRLAAAALPAGLIALWLLTLNQLRYGNPFSTGYVKFGTLFETPLLTGLGAYAFDPDLSLFLFAPAFTLALFGLRRAFRRAPVLLLAATGVFVVDTVLHALHTGYHGGTCYGPRYLIAAIPVLTASGIACLVQDAAPVRRRLIGAALGLAFVLQLPSVLVSPLEYHTLRGTVRARGGDIDAIRPRFTTDWRLLAHKLSGDTLHYDLADFVAEGAAPPADSSYDVPRMDRGLSIWWVLAAGEGRRVALVPGMALLFGAGVVGAGLLRLLGTVSGGEPGKVVAADGADG